VTIILGGDSKEPSKTQIIKNHQPTPRAVDVRHQVTLEDIPSSRFFPW